MPIFHKPGEPPVFFAHVPRTGGTYIGTLFGRNGYESLLSDGRSRKVGLDVSLRHLDRSAFGPLIRPMSFKLSFMTVRHPVDRLLSVYRHRLGRSAHTGLAEWLRQAEDGLALDPHCMDNHLRPQVEFRAEAFLVFRQEDGFDAGWARALSLDHGLGFGTFEVRAGKEGAAHAPAPTSGEARALLGFCARHYAADFAAFGYDPDAAQAFRAPRSQPQGAGPATRPRTTEPARGPLARAPMIQRLRDLLDRPPAPLVLSNALVAPLRYLPGQNRIPVALRAQTGLYDEGGRYMHDATLFRLGKALDTPGRFEPARDRPETVLFGGRLFDHFGHFLTEGLARLWCADAFPGAPVAWTVAEGSGPSGLRPWQRDLLDRMVGEREHILVDAPTRFAQVVLAKPGFVIPDRFAPWHRKALERAGVDYRPQPGQRLWLSRRGHDRDEGLLNGASLETHLARAGWRILRPETVPLAEQVAAFAGSEQVAGEEGSALHLALLLRNARRLRLDILARRITAESVKEAYATIARGKGFPHRAHSVPEEIILRTRLAQATRVARHFRGHLDALGVPVLEPAPAGPSPWAADLEAIGARLPAGARVLQLGGRVGAGPPPAQDRRVVLVSDDIGADPRSQAASTCELLEMVPDLCLRLDLLEGQSFDLVLVADGAGLPEAALRALVRPGGILARPGPGGRLAVEEAGT